jgi:hypothetical protein
MRLGRSRRLLAGGIAAVALAFVFIASAGNNAQAGENHFCWGVTMTPQEQFCNDSVTRNVYAVYANSTEARVCVGVSGGALSCSKKPNEGVYIGSLGGVSGTAYLWQGNVSVPPFKAYGVVWDGPPAPPTPPPPPPNPPALPDIFAVTMNNSGSKATEMHVLKGSTTYQSWGTQLPTPLGETQLTQWQWMMGNTDGDKVPDLMGVTMNNTGSKKTEVHILTGASNYQSWGTQLPTPLAETQPSQWQWLMGDSDANGDGIADLVGIDMNTTGSGKTEVHILNGATNYQTWLTQLPTPLAETQPSQWQWLMGDANGDNVPDLVGVDMNNTGSKHTEVHILNGATNYQTWLTQLPTPLAETQPSQWQWTMSDENSDGIADLVGMDLNGTGSGKTEVHTLNGATNYQTWLTQVPTALSETSASQWRFFGTP